MSLIELMLGTAVCGYLALTIIGAFATASINTFINRAIGRKKDPDPPWPTLFGLIYSLAYLWAIGFTASQEGGKLNLALGKAKYDMEHGDLTTDEITRLREACSILKETSQF